MAQVTLTTRFSQLDNWPGHLLEAEGNETIVTRNATTFTYRYGSGHDFQGYTVSIVGTGFTWNGDVATGGRVQSLTIRDGAGDLILSVSGITAATLASDLAQFQSVIFGVEDQINPEVWAAWNYLMSGNDTITGTNEDDWRVPVGANRGNNVFNMRGGDDWIEAGAGRDTINGGDGDDWLSYQTTYYSEGATAFQGAIINVKTRTAIDPWGNTDKFTSIENFVGSRFDDRFVGGNDRDRFTGGRGDDTINGGGGEKDEARYARDYDRGATMGLIVNLQAAVSSGSIIGTVRDGFGDTDRLIDVERVEGTRFADRFTGSSANNDFWGGEGRDTFDGKGGYDTLRMERQFTDRAMTGVNVDLSRASGQIINDGFGNTENATSFEAVLGSYRADRIKGNAADNWLEAGEGADTLTGAAGRDTFFWWSEEEIGPVDVITDFTLNGPGSDVLGFDHENFTGMTDTVRLVNGNAATIAQGQFVFRASNHTLYWDPDGTGSDAAIAVARLTGVNALTRGDFDLG